MVIASLALVLLCPLVARAVSFNFSLAQGSKTSAGVFRADGTLVKTLWSGVPYAAGRYTKEWDGIDDAGHLAPDGRYQVRVLTSHCTYNWEGVVGNTSTAKSGPTVFNPMNTMSGMAVAGTNAYVAFGYNEQNPSPARFSTGSIGAKTYLLGAGPMFLKVATDGTNVYWAGSSGSYSDGFVMGTTVGTDAQTAFPSGKPVTVEFTTCSNTIDHVTGVVGAMPSGVAVQQSLHGTGHKGYLFVARKDLNSLHVLDKTSGALVQSLTFTKPGDLAVDGNDDLWMLHTGTVQHFTVNLDAAGKFVSLTPGLTISALVKPLALACNRAGTLLVADGGASQQVKAFDSAGSPLWTLGQAGGYATEPAVADDKFDFEPTLLGATYGVFLAFQPDGSFWVEDPGDYRTQHFTAAGKFIDRIAYVPIHYSAAADPNNPTRVFANFLEYQIDYGLPFGPTNGSWKLVRNWRTGVPGNEYAYNPYTRMKYVTTLRNGRTYAFLGYFDLYELPTNGLLRATGITVSQLQSIYPDGSIRSVSSSNSVETWTQQTLTGFDEKNNPRWAPPVVRASIPVGPGDPRDVEDGGGASFVPLRPGRETAGGVIVSYDVLNFARGSRPLDHHGWHLGGVRPGGSTWLWKASPNLPSNYSGPYPSDGSFAVMNNDGNLFQGGTLMTVDHHILTQFVGVGGANEFNHFYDDGLFVDTFGWSWAMDGNIAAPPKAATDCYSCWLVKLADGRVFFYQNDGGEHSGVHRWRIDGLDTVAEQKIEVRWRQHTRPGLQAEYFNAPDWNNRYGVRSQIDSQINFNWGMSPSETAGQGTAALKRTRSEIAFHLAQGGARSPSALLINRFSARWTGYVQPPVSENYTFQAVADGVTRLWVDGQLVNTGRVALTAGVLYPVKIEYQSTNATASLALKWSSASLPAEIIPSARLACSGTGLRRAEVATATQAGVSPGQSSGVSKRTGETPVPLAATSDLLAGLAGDSELTTGTSGDYGWSWTPGPSYAYRDSWFARTNMRTRQLSPPGDLTILYGKATNATATLTRDLGLASETTTQWEISARLNFEKNFTNHGAGGGQYLEVLDDAGKIIARFYSTSVAWPTDHRVYGNTAILAQTDALALNKVMEQWQPFRITAQNGQVTFQYAAYPPVTAKVLEAGANWRRAKTLRFYYWTAGAGYGRTISLAALTFTTSN